LTYQSIAFLFAEINVPGKHRGILIDKQITKRCPMIYFSGGQVCLCKVSQVKLTALNLNLNKHVFWRLYLEPGLKLVDKD
jgi:hypothetical protein